MKNIVKIENNEATVSIVDISTFSGVSEKAIISTIRNNKEDFSRFGNIKLALNVSHMHRLLNEAETTFLLTLLKNTKEVVKFKSDLVFQFYKMREHICEVNKHQLDAKDKQIKKLSYTGMKTYNGGFTSLRKYIKENDINLSEDEAWEILKVDGVIENRDIETMKRVLLNDEAGRQASPIVGIEFNPRFLDTKFSGFIEVLPSLLDGLEGN